MSYYFVNILKKEQYLVQIQGFTFLFEKRNYYRINVELNVNTIYYYRL